MDMEFNKRLEQLEQEIQKIRSRNKRVEGDKSWETSLTRISFISVITYLCTALIFWLIGVENYFRNALIPTAGYILSVQSLPVLKNWWFRRYYS